MLRVILLGSSLLAIAVAPVTLRSFAEGPAAGFTGAFNEPTCAECHLGNDLNAPGGSLTLSGLPEAYAAGESYTLTVELWKDGLKRGGFQLAARVASGPDAGRGAGTLVLPGADLQLVKSDDGRVAYVQHTIKSTRPATTGRIAWQFRWTAPANAVPVRFDVAANAANDDESPMDDFVYTATRTTKPRQVTRPRLPE